jgi:hypothetical protein
MPGLSHHVTQRGNRYEAIWDLTDTTVRGGWLVRESLPLQAPTSQNRDVGHPLRGGCGIWASRLNLLSPAIGEWGGADHVLEDLDESADASESHGKSSLSNRTASRQFFESNKHTQMLEPLSDRHPGLALEVTKKRAFRHARKSCPIIETSVCSQMLQHLICKSLESRVNGHWEMQ